MNDLLRELAPISAKGWSEIEGDARHTLSTHLAARKLVDFEGPRGWETSSVSTGRTESLGNALADGVDARLRTVQPLVELTVDFELARAELDAIDRGADDPDLDALQQAARRLALAEDRLVFLGHPQAGIRGLYADAEHEPIPLADGGKDYPDAVSRAIDALRDRGVAGPYAIALGRRCYRELARVVSSGYPLIRHVQRLLDGPVVWAPSLDGALVVSQRGSDAELVVGRDVSVGYRSHDADVVRLYMVESLTFRFLAPEIAVPLRHDGHAEG